MSLAKPSLSATSNALKADDENQYDIYLRQAMENDNSSVHYVQLVHPFGRPDLPGWPLLTPLKMPCHKCEKCPLEFCSLMNYRRHIRMHRRSSNIDKESHKNRNLLAAFWDKLSLEEARRVVSFDDISLEGVPGSLIVNTWDRYLFKVIVLSLPDAYLRDGTILSEIILGKSSRLPISSEELFSILDETSERTFLCAGTAESVQKFIIDGGAVEVLELRNLVASISLLFEQKLVKAWVADKEAEALRCHKILMEEEELAQKRQTQKLERQRQRQRKLRQNELKASGPLYGEKLDCSSGEKTDSDAGEKTNSNSLDSNADFVEGQASAENSIPQFSSDNCCDTLTDFKPSLEQINFSGKENEFVETHCDYSSDHVGIASLEFVGSHREWSTNDLYHSTDGTWQVPKYYRKRQVGFYNGHNPSTAKHEALQKQRPANEMSLMPTGVKIWARKSNIAVDESSRTRVQNEVAKIALDVESSRTSGQNVVAESEVDVKSSRTTLQNVISELEIDVETSRTTLQNVVSKGQTDVERSGTSSQNVVASHMDMSNCKLLIGSISVSVINSTPEQHVKGASTDSSEKCATPEKLNNSQESDPILKVQDPTIGMPKDVFVYGVKSNLSVTNSIAEQHVSQGVLTDSSEKCATPEKLNNSQESDPVQKLQDPTIAKSKDVCVYEVRSDLPVTNSTEEQYVSQGALTDSKEKCATPDKLNNSQESNPILKGQDPTIAMSKDVCVYKVSSNLSETNSIAEEHVSQGALTDSSEKCATLVKLNNSQELDPILQGQDPTIAMSKDVCVYEGRSDLLVPMDDQNCGENATLQKVEDLAATFLLPSAFKPNVQPEGSVLSSFDAKAFLEQRWKDVMASDHVKLVLSPEPSVVADATKDCPSLDQKSDRCHYNKSSDAETPVAGVEPHVSFMKENSKAKFKKKTKKGATRTK